MCDFDLYSLMTGAGFKNEKELALFFDVSEKTVGNWRKREPPKAVKISLELMNGQLDCLGKPWRGFRLTPEAIESPEGDFIYAHEVRAIRYVYHAAGVNRARMCNMLKHTVPLRRNRKKPDVKNPVKLKIVNG